MAHFLTYPAPKQGQRIDYSGATPMAVPGDDPVVWLRGNDRVSPALVSASDETDAASLYAQRCADNGSAVDAVAVVAVSLNTITVRASAVE